MQNNMLYAFFLNLLTDNKKMFVCCARMVHKLNIPCSFNWMESNTANWRKLNEVVGSACQMTDFIQEIYLVLYMHLQSASVNM